MISTSSTTRDLPISAEQVTEDFAGAMETLTPSTVTSSLSLQQPKIEIDLCSQGDLNLVPFQQLETQLLDSMEIAEQQSSQSCILKVFDDEHMEEVDGNIKMLSPGDKNSTYMDDMSPTRGENQPVILGTSPTASNAINAPALKIGFNKQLKHGDRLRKYIREYGKIPIIFLKKDGHPTGKHASVFMTELGIAVRNTVPFKISGWKDVTEEQKQRICDTLESSFAVDFGSGPNSVRKETEKLMNVRFRNYRRYMHRHYKTLAHLPWGERLKCVPTEYCESEADWEFMCTMFESEAFKKKSAVNSENAKSPYANHRVSKPLTQYKYDVKAASSNGPDTNPEKGCPRESATIANIGSDNHDDGSRSFEGMDAANRAGDQVRENCAGCTSGLSNGIESENAKSTSIDDTLGTVTEAELRNALASTQEELHSTKMSLQTTQDKVRILEANQKRLEERMEANERVMKQVFERIASDITQSLTQLPSSAPRL